MNNICKLCDKLYKNAKALVAHINRGHHISSKDYYNKFLKESDEGVCIVCGGETSFVSITKGYSSFCSLKCSNNSPLVKQKYIDSCLSRYGVTSTNKLENVKEKKKQTCLTNFGVEYGPQNKEIQARIKNTNIEKYGFSISLKNAKIKEKSKKSLLEHYGVDSPLKSKVIQNKIKEFCLKKHGVEHQFQSDYIKNKIIDTNIKKYGKQHVLQVEKIRDKCNKTKYKNTYSKLCSYTHVIPLFTEEEFTGIGYYDNLYKWKCAVCGNIFENYIKSHIPRCLICDPILSNTSNKEREVQGWLSSLLPIECNKRFYFDNNHYELDVFIESSNMGVEFDGIYWHSELAGKGKSYHINKNKVFNSIGINIIHIYENEWVLKQDIVKSIILNRLNLIKNKIYARKCSIKSISQTDYNVFLENNHIQGVVTSKYRYGLYYNNEMVSVIGFGKSRFKHDEVELIRFCCLKNVVVVGAFSRLVAFFRNFNVGPIVTYCDVRYFNAVGYEKVGFKKIGQTNPSYHYFKSNDNTLELFNRMQFQKHKLKEKLKIYNENLTEWENMQLNGYNRIWDCGQIKLKLL